jgi:hypothetical protein
MLSQHLLYSLRFIEKPSQFPPWKPYHSYSWHCHSVKKGKNLFGGINLSRSLLGDWLGGKKGNSTYSVFVEVDMTG